MRPLRVHLLSIVPSPYQRDLLGALAARPEVDLRVTYGEAQSPDSPWPAKPLRPFESVLPGFYLRWGQDRFLINRAVPDIGGLDCLIYNGYITLPAQRLLRRRLPLPQLFWAEKMVAGSTGLKGRIQRWLARPLERMSGIVAIGRGAVEDYERRYPGKPVYWLPYYCEIGAFGEAIPPRPRKPGTILFCGQMIHRKGVDLLLEAFARLPAEHGTRLLLVGREAELPQMLEKIPAEVRKRVEFAGFQAPEALPEFFRRADLFVLPSRYDGWGVVVNQALGAGLPMICSDAVGAARDIIEDGVNGSIFPSGEVDALAQALRYWAEDPDRLRAASDACLRQAPAWTPEAGAERWVHILQEQCRKN